MKGKRHDLEDSVVGGLYRLPLRRGRTDEQDNDPVAKMSGDLAAIVADHQLDIEMGCSLA
jgi:hypothetical protein